MKKAVPYILLLTLFGGAAWYSLMKPAEPVDELPPPVTAPVETDTQVQTPPQAGTEVI